MFANYDSHDKRVLGETRRLTYVQRKTEARSRNHCCRGKAKSIKYYECGTVFLLELCGMQIFCAVLYCHLWPEWLYNIFPHYLIKGTIFGKKKL